MSDAELIKQARKRAELRRKIRGEPDRIADLLDALCDSIERLSGELAVADYQSQHD